MHRGFSIVEKKWVYGYLFVAEDNKGRKQHQILVPDRLIGLYKMYVVKPDSVEGYIQYNDIHNNRIYEGDYLRAEYWDPGDMPRPLRKFVGKACITEGVASMYSEEVAQYLPLYQIQKVEKISKEEYERWQEILVRTQ